MEELSPNHGDSFGRTIIAALEEAGAAILKTLDQAYGDILGPDSRNKMISQRDYGVPENPSIADLDLDYGVPENPSIADRDYTDQGDCDSPSFDLGEVPVNGKVPSNREIRRN
ncbi:MAG: hypothetical protein ABEJ93_01595 [Candidatus Nanohalobium sp.]